MAEAISKSRNVSVLLYHLVCPAKYRRKIFSQEVSKSLLEVCFDITVKYEIEFIEVGSDNDHVHFLIQGIHGMSPSEIVRIVKSITAGEIYRPYPEVKAMLWGGNIWTSGSCECEDVGRKSRLGSTLKIKVEKRNIRRYMAIS